MPYRYSRLGGRSSSCCCKFFVALIVLSVIAALIILLLNPIHNVNIVAPPPIDLQATPVLNIKANVSAWFHINPLIKYHWTLPDGTSSSSASPTWNASLISQYVTNMDSTNASLPSFSLTVSGLLPFIKAHAVAVPFEYFVISSPTIDLTTSNSANCTGLPPGQIIVPALNVAIGTILFVNTSCGTTRKVNEVMQVLPNGYLIVNTSAVGLTDIYQELSTSGNMPGGGSVQSPSSSRSLLGSNKFLEWLLEPGSISVSGSAAAQVSVTPIVRFSPSVTYSFLVSGWRVQHASLGVSGDLTLGISFNAQISGEASLTASVPLCPPMKGEPIWLPIGPPPGIPLVPALTAEASVQFSFQAAETFTASTQLTISASVSATYDQQNGWTADHSFSTTKFYSPPSSLKSCGWSAEVTMRPAMELSLFDFYPSLSLGPSAGFKLSATSAPENPSTTLSQTQHPQVSSSGSLSALVSTANNITLPSNPVTSSFRNLDLEGSSEPSDCKYCADVTPGTNPGYMSAELVGIWTPWDVDLSILPWLSQSWGLGEQESSPWWEQCYELGPTSSCNSCCGPPLLTKWTTPAGSIGPPAAAAWFVPCSMFNWLSSSARYCFVIMPLPTPNLPPGGCYLWLPMTSCSTPSSFNFALDFQVAQGGNSEMHWICTQNCSFKPVVNLGQGGTTTTTFVMQGGTLNPSTWTKVAYDAPTQSAFSGGYC